MESIRSESDVLKSRIKHYLGAAKIRLPRIMRNSHGVIVTFHSVTEEKTNSNIAITVAQFRDYCDFFKRFFAVISLSEMIARLEAKSDLSNSLVITFDDGYKDNLKIVAKELLVRNLPATFFVTTGYIESDYVPYWDERCGEATEWMSWDDVIELHNLGFEIGSHTLNHPRLAKISQDEAWSEIRGGHEELSQRLQQEVSHFAYPFGGDMDMREESRFGMGEIGIRSCLACSGGVVRQGDDALHLNRVAVTPWHVSPPHFWYEVGQLTARRPVEAVDYEHSSDLIECSTDEVQ